MKLFHQLILFVLAATAVPLIVGFFILRHSEGQLEKRLLASREESAVRLAEVVHREMKEVFERVQGALGYASVEGMSPEELTGLLGILYKQSEDIVQVALLGTDGVEVVPGVYLDHPERYPEYAGRLGVTRQAHSAFVRGLPLAQALEASPDALVLGIAHMLSGEKGLSISFVVPMELTSSENRWFAAVELSLERIIKRVVEAGDTRGWNAWMVDGDGKIIAHADRDKVIARTDMSELEPVVLLSEKPHGAFFREDAMNAFARVPLVDWGVVIQQTRSEALAEVRRARRVTVIWTGVSILALLLLGGLFTGRITRNLGKLVSGTEEFTRGNLDARVDVYTGDEVGLLARTFNRMGEELKTSREEIEEWNRELSRRVDERTRELEITHGRLLETSKLAAIGQLGAGVAHEINNPLVGILGNVQLAMKKYDGPEQGLAMLQKIEKAAQRCREVTQNLLRFSEQEEDPEHIAVDLNQALRDAFSLTEQQMRAQDISTTWELEPGLKVMGDQRQLMRVFLNLFSNARTAMKESGGSLGISSRRVNAELVQVEVTDTGKGIAPDKLDHIFDPFFTTKDVWTNTGLGLSVAYRVISDHGGQVSVVSEVDKGSRFTVKLPAYGEQS
jgi:two-component system, NtrC family, sensor kinase